MIDERDLREMLDRRVRTISATPTDARKAVWRARGRLIRNGVVAGLVTIVAVVGAFAGVRTIEATPTPATPPTPSVPPTARTQVMQTQDPDFDGKYRITMDLLDGYEAAGVNGVVFGSDPGQGIGAWTVGNVYEKPCRWHQTLLYPPIDSSVDGLVAGLEGQKGRRHATTPTDVELGGYAGKFIEMTVPAGIDTSRCDGGEFRTWVDRTFTGQRSLEAGQRDLLWIVDVDGKRLVIDAALGPETTAQDRADRIQMVESIQIEAL